MTRRQSRWLPCTMACLVAALVGHPSAQPSDAQAVFQRGLEALHEFEYEEANAAFQRARQLDPGFAMAYWGEAMTYHQTLWRHEDVPAGRQALARLGPTPAARRAKAANPREQGLLAAVDTLYGEGDVETRKRRYAEAMGRLHETAPDDPDVASLYALALLGTMSRGLIGYVDSHEGHSQMLAGSEIQQQVAAILDKVLRSHPTHPGALHYLLHDYDDPQHAHLALPAARTLAKLAPDASHALHMPSHVFVQLGLWHDAAASDRAAFDASSAWVARRHLDAAMRNYHSLAWLQYELLQLGRYRDAGATFGEIEPVVKASGQLGLLSDLSTMRARDVIETEQWKLMAGATSFGNANELFAIGLSAAHTGNRETAERARQALADHARDPREGDLRPAIAIMEREVAGVMAFEAGRSADAVEILKAAASAEDQLPPPLGLPQPVKPAPELLGEVLIDLGRPNEATPFFEQTLRRNAKRSRAILGLSRAAAKAGRPDAARILYQELLANLDGADADVPMLLEARQAAQPASASTGSRSVSALVAGFAAIALVGVLFLTRRRRSTTLSPLRHRTTSARADRSRRGAKKRARSPGP